MYATLYQTKQYLTQRDNTVHDGLLLFDLGAATNLITQYSGWDFIPYRKTILHDVPQVESEQIGVYGGYYQSYQDVFRDTTRLKLRQPLLELESGINGDELALDLADLLYIERDLYPYHSLKFKKSSGLTWVGKGEDQEEIISLTGLWGYHEQYDLAGFVDSLDTVQNNPLAINGTTLTVLDSAGLAGDGQMQRFQAGQMLKLTDGTDYEFVYVGGVNGNDLTITRGYRGTVAKEWLQATPIYLYRPMEGVTQATMEVTRLIYRRRDLDAGDTKQIIGTNIKITPETLPDYITAMLPTPRTFWSPDRS